MNITYSNLSNIGFIKKTKNYIRNDKGISYNFNDFNKFFFGSDLKNDIAKLDLRKENIIYYNDFAEAYIYQEKIGEYLMFVEKKLDLENGNYLCMNYYKFLGKKLKGKQLKIYNAIENIKISLKNIIKQNESSENYKKIINEIILEYIGTDFFKGTISSTLDITNGGMILIKFDTLNKPFYITLIEENIENCNYININEDYNPVIYYSYLSKLIDIILMNDKDSYMFEKIFKINGNESFTKLFLDSWKQKEKYVVDIDDLNILIQFKSDKLKKEYHRKFFKKYIENCKLENKNLMLNFEGINKYLLFLDSKFLINENSKDPIIDMFNKSMIELLKTYEELYQNSILK
jgi:hypothetical protein